MKAYLWFAVRFTTGAMLLIWGSIKLTSPYLTQSVSKNFYANTLSAEWLQAPLGVAQVTVGVLVIIGFMRRYIYPVQAVIFGYTAVFLWKFLIDPMGLFFFDVMTRKILFFPSTTLAAVSLILIFYQEDDTFSLDKMIEKRKAASA